MWSLFDAKVVVQTFKLSSSGSGGGRALAPALEVSGTVQSLIMHMIGAANLGQILMHYDIFTPKLCIISLCIMSDCTVVP